MNEIPGGKVRAHVWVSGRVQGVGFRAFVEHIGNRIGVTGWVRNIGRDGVEAVAEGERSSVDQFIEAMKKGPSSGRVVTTRVEWETQTGEFASFEIRSSK